MSDAPRVAVYFLVGDDDESPPQCYIGQTGDVRVRLPQHAEKDFWTRALVATSLTGRWTSTHVALLEWLSINRAREAGRFGLVNGNNAVRPYTPAPLESECHEFFETIAVLLTTFGHPILDPATSVRQTGGISPRQSVEFRLTEGNCDARGRQSSEGFTVLSGSRGRAIILPAAPGTVAVRRAGLEAEQVIRTQGDQLMFLKDHEFSSPTAAAQILVGGSVNGRVAWRNSEGKTLKQIEEEDLGAAAGG